MYYLLAALSGVAMAAQGLLNARLGKLIGPWNALFLATLTAWVLAIFPALVTLPALPGQLPKIPWYLFLGGPLVAIITWLVLTAIPRLGMANTTTAILLGQLGAAFYLDHLGAFGLDRQPFHGLKLLGLALLAAGARILLG